MPDGFIDFVNGCGPFWIANSITSTILGETNRDLQRKISEENEQFQLKLERMRYESQEKIEAERIAFRRHLMDITRDYQRQERAQAANNMDKQVEISFFASQWPLDLPAATILEQTKKNHHNLNVILIHNPIIASEKGMIKHRENYITNIEQDIYKLMEFSISQDAQQIGDVHFRQDACNKKEKKNPDYIMTAADIMNIHFIMGSIPTLVIMPKYQDNMLYLSAAMWDELAARPLIRPLFALQHDPVLAYKDEKYRKEVIERLHYTVSIITGVVRDQYAVLTWGKQPTLHNLLNAPQNGRMKQFAKQSPAIKGYISQEYQSTLKALETDNKTSLLQAYGQTDIDRMKAMIAEQEEFLNA